MKFTGVLEVFCTDIHPILNNKILNTLELKILRCLRSCSYSYYWRNVAALEICNDPLMQNRLLFRYVERIYSIYARSREMKFIYDEGNSRVSESDVLRPNWDQLAKMQLLGLRLGVAPSRLRTYCSALPSEPLSLAVFSYLRMLLDR